MATGTTAAPAAVGEATTTERGVGGDGRPDPGSAAARVQRLFELHGRMVYGLCRLLLRDPTEAEDAAQQVFVSAYGALLRGTVVREPAAWLAAAARNECRGRLRRRSEAPLAIEDATAELLEAPGDDGARVLDVAYVRHALAALPERQREAVVLRDVLGFRTGEAAAALGLSRPAVESLVFRARRSLRVRLRHAATVTVLPLALREGVAEALPAASGPVRVAATATGGGLLAKLGAAPLAAKLAAGAAAVGTAGSVALELDRPREPQRPAPAPTLVAREPATTVERSTDAVVPLRRHESRGSSHSASVPIIEVADDRSGPSRQAHEIQALETTQRNEHRGDSSGPGPGPAATVGTAEPEPEPESAPEATVLSEPEPSSSSGPGSGETTTVVDETSGGDLSDSGSGSSSGDGGESGGGPGPG